MAIARDPRNPGGYRFLGEIYLAKANRQDDAVASDAAVDSFQQAVSLYPNHAATQSLLAEALQKAGKTRAARDAARRAGELDQINERAGHADKRLPDARRRLVEEILKSDSN
jgi:cytochrome c-type biogenesis protein CcmH/NrfG